jgi:hypothetical protein
LLLELVLSLTRSKALIDAVVESQVSKSAKPGAPGFRTAQDIFVLDSAFSLIEGHPAKDGVPLDLDGILV